VGALYEFIVSGFFLLVRPVNNAAWISPVLKGVATLAAWKETWHQRAISPDLTLTLLGADISAELIGMPLVHKFRYILVYILAHTHTPTHVYIYIFINIPIHDRDVDHICRYTRIFACRDRCHLKTHRVNTTHRDPRQISSLF
jgi:hypothetical protein